MCIRDRLGFAAPDVAIIELLVAHHLTLIDLATSRDPEDPLTVEAVCEAVGWDAAVLDLLAALSRADAASVGELSLIHI